MINDISSMFLYDADKDHDSKLFLKARMDPVPFVKVREWVVSMAIDPHLKNEKRTQMLFQGTWELLRTAVNDCQTNTSVGRFIAINLFRWVSFGMAADPKSKKWRATPGIFYTALNTQINYDNKFRANQESIINTTVPTVWWPFPLGKW